jgi:hypothetical protein
MNPEFIGKIYFHIHKHKWKIKLKQKHQQPNIKTKKSKTNLNLNVHHFNTLIGFTFWLWSSEREPIVTKYCTNERKKWKDEIHQQKLFFKIYFINVFSSQLPFFPTFFPSCSFSNIHCSYRIYQTPIDFILASF